MKESRSQEAVQTRLARLKEGFESRWIEVGGLPIHARISVDRAPADAPAVVLVHGLGLSSTYLLPTADALACDYRVYAPDLPGFGRSGKPQAILDVPALGDALVGNSFGCQIIVECIARHPDQVARAVLQGPTTPPSERSWFWQFVR